MKIHVCVPINLPKSGQFLVKLQQELISNWQTDEMEVVLYDTPKSHWDKLTEATQHTNAEYMFYLDQDMLVYDPGIMNVMIEKIKEGYDVVTILDKTLKVIFPANENRAERSRFCPYLCLIKKDLVLEAGNDFTPTENYDTMGKMTEIIMQKHPDIKIYELPDDRSSLYLRENGEFEASSNLDGSPYKWSPIVSRSMNYGYYHIRNANLGLLAIDSYQSDKEEYERIKAITPSWELLRVLGWWHHLAYPSSLSPDEYYNFALRIKDIAKDLGVEWHIWDEYVGKFEDFYPWIKNI